MKWVALGLAAGLAFVLPAAEAEVFKCKDAEGRVTYTDVPCLRSETSSVIDTRSSVATAPQGQSQSAAPAPQPPAPAAPSTPRPSGYR
jgi:hypothetical protein